jgi:hypothetical protein
MSLPVLVELRACSGPNRNFLLDQPRPDRQSTLYRGNIQPKERIYINGMEREKRNGAGKLTHKYTYYTMGTADDRSSRKLRTEPVQLVGEMRISINEL